MVAGADVYLVGVYFVVHLGGYGASLGNFLGNQPLPLQHVEEVGVAAKVQLVGVVNGSAPVLKQPGQDTVEDGSADLGLNVVANDRHSPFHEPVPPILFAGDKHGDAVDHAAAGVKNLLRVPLGRHFAAHGEVVNDHVHFPFPENVGNVYGRVGRLSDQVGHVPANAVVGHAPFHRDPGTGDVGKLDGVVGFRKDGFGQVLAHLVFVYVKGGYHFNVFNAVVPNHVVHYPRNFFLGGNLNVFVQALNER